MQIEPGFLIEYSVKSGFLEPIGETQKAFVTRERDWASY